MRKYIAVILICTGCLFLSSCGKDGGLGATGSQGSAGTAGATGPSGLPGLPGAGTRVVYTGTIGTHPWSVNIPEITLSDIPSITTYFYFGAYGGWIDSASCLSYAEGKAQTYNNLYVGYQYKIVIIK